MAAAGLAMTGGIPIVGGRLEAVKFVLIRQTSRVDENGNTAPHGAAFTGARSVILLLAGAVLDVSETSSTTQ